MKMTPCHEREIGDPTTRFFIHELVLIALLALAVGSLVTMTRLSVRRQRPEPIYKLELDRVYQAPSKAT